MDTAPRLPRGGFVSEIALFPSNLRPFGAPPSIGRRGMTTRAPSLGRGCRAQRGGVGFLLGRRSPLLFAFPIREGGPRQRRSGAFVDGALETISPALFHPARTPSGSLRSPPSPRGEGFVRRYCFSTYACICFDNTRKAVFSFPSLPHWGRGTAQRWIRCSRKRRT